MRHFLPAFRLLIFMTFLTGALYPAFVTVMSQAVFSRQANGQLMQKKNMTVGSKLISQKFESPQYFWGRPSAIDFNPLPSGGSNLGQNSADLKKVYEERKAKLKAAHPEMTEDPPQDLLFASGSGLDPEISPEASRYQIQRVAKARGMDVNEVNKIVDSVTLDRDFGIFGEPRVNVLNLNLALDETQAK